MLVCVEMPLSSASHFFMVSLCVGWHHWFAAFMVSQSVRCVTWGSVYVQQPWFIIMHHWNVTGRPQKAFFSTSGYFLIFFRVLLYISLLIRHLAGHT
jgi:hypothetical protein